MPHADQERALVLQRYVFNSILNLACHNHLSLHSEYGIIRTRSCIADQDLLSGYGDMNH